MPRKLEEGPVVREVALVGEYALPFGPFHVGSSAEWAFERKQVDALRNLAAISGGRELLDPKKA